MVDRRAGLTGARGRHRPAWRRRRYGSRPDRHRLCPRPGFTVKDAVVAPATSSARSAASTSGPSGSTGRNSGAVWPHRQPGQWPPAQYHQPRAPGGGSTAAHSARDGTNRQPCDGRATHAFGNLRQLAVNSTLVDRRTRSRPGAANLLSQVVLRPSRPDRLRGADHFHLAKQEVAGERREHRTGCDSDDHRDDGCGVGGDLAPGAGQAQRLGVGGGSCHVLRRWSSEERCDPAQVVEDADRVVGSRRQRSRP